MKKIKFILGIILITVGFGGVISGSQLGGISLSVLGTILLPPISRKVKDNVAFLKKKTVRYITYILLFLFSVGSMKKSELLETKRVKKTDLILKDSTETNSKTTDKYETCEYGGGKSYIIPDMNAADVYMNFENKGFKINKQIESGNTSIYCELSSPMTKYAVIVTGCSPEEIIEIEATANDYSGNNQNEMENFLGYVATLQYKNSEPEKARRWLSDNIDIDGAKTTIGGVTFSINFKSNLSKFLRIYVTDPKDISSKN